MFLTLAREIAMDIHPLETILRNHEITQARWNEIKDNPRFIYLLQTQMEEWNRAMNTAERVRIKALACIEEAMPEFYARMHDTNENLPAKVKALEVFGQLAGMGKSTVATNGGAEKFSVTINLGADQVLKVSAPAPAPAVLDQ